MAWMKTATIGLLPDAAMRTCRPGRGILMQLSLEHEQLLLVNGMGACSRCHASRAIRIFTCLIRWRISLCKTNDMSVEVNCKTT